MSISCDCSCDGYDYAEIYDVTFPTARKTYKCCECGEEIKPGQKYNNVKGLWDGEWSTYRTCIACNNIRSHYCPGGFIFGELRETIKECLDFDYCEVPEEDDE